MTDAFQRLRAAVLAYAEGLKRYAAFGEVWAGEAPDLDELWADVLAACELDPDSDPGASE